MEENNRVEQCVGLFEKTVPVTFFIVGNIRITYVGTIFESKINTVVTHKFNSVGNIPSYTVGNMRNEIKTNVSWFRFPKIFSSCWKDLSWVFFVSKNKTAWHSPAITAFDNTLVGTMDTDFFVPADANFRIIRGKQKSSKIYVKEPFTYVHDKTMAGGDRIYLKCRTKSCYCRAVVENGKFLKIANDRQHNCWQSEAAALTNITCLELQTKMKMRAETESASFFVSTLFSFYFM